MGEKNMCEKNMGEKRWVKKDTGENFLKSMAEKR